MRKKIIILAVVMLAAIQFVPESVFPRSNSPVDEAKTVQAGAKALPADVHRTLRRACYDCHSSQTVWPWYSRIAPAGWLVSHDVKEGRRELNFSAWGAYAPDRAARKLKEVCEQVERGEMPLWYYTPMHPAAKLSDGDRKAICAWTEAERAALLKQ